MNTSNQSPKNASLLAVCDVSYWKGLVALPCAAITIVLMLGPEAAYGQRKVDKGTAMKIFGVGALLGRSMSHCGFEKDARWLQFGFHLREIQRFILTQWGGPTVSRSVNLAVERYGKNVVRPKKRISLVQPHLSCAYVGSRKRNELFNQTINFGRSLGVRLTRESLAKEELGGYVGLMAVIRRAHRCGYDKTKKSRGYVKRAQIVKKKFRALILKRYSSAQFNKYVDEEKIKSREPYKMPCGKDYQNLSVVYLLLASGDYRRAVEHEVFFQQGFP